MVVNRNFHFGSGLLFLALLEFGFLKPAHVVARMLEVELLRTSIFYRTQQERLSDTRGPRRMRLFPLVPLRRRL